MKENYGNSIGWVTDILHSGLAFEKMQEIIKAQGGNPNIDSEDLQPGSYSYDVKAKEAGTVKKIHSRNATIIAKILGCPKIKRAGIYLHKKIGDKVTKGEVIQTIYAQKEYDLKEAKESLNNFPILLYY